MCTLSLSAKFILISVEKYVAKYNVGTIDKKYFFEKHIMQYIKCDKTFNKYLAELEYKEYIRIKKDKKNKYNKDFIFIDKPSSDSILDEDYQGVIVLVVPTDCYVIVQPHNQNITYKLEYPTDQYLIFSRKPSEKIIFSGFKYQQNIYQYSFKDISNERII